MNRNHVIINHSGFFGPLLQGLKGYDLMPVFEQWEPEPELCSQSLACFIWFYDALRHPLKVIKLKKYLRRYGVPLVAWNRDAPHYLNRKSWRLDLLDRIRLFDIYATHTLIDSNRHFADTELFLQNAVDPMLYHLMGPEKEVLGRMRDSGNYRYDVSFFGGMGGTRHKEDLDRQLFFNDLTDRLEHLGISYLFIDTGNEGMEIEKQIEIIQTSRINLNYGARCEYQAPIASGLPERFFGIPACGGFLLGDQRTHTKDCFEVGVHLDDFSNIDECVSKIVHYLSHFNQTRDIAEKAYHHVHKQHTYDHRAETLHQALMAWHEGERGLLR